MGKPVSIRQFAKMRGVSHTAVNKAIRVGRVTTTPDGKIDPDTVNAEWDANTDPSKQREVPKSSTTASSAYAVARAIREEYNARNARLSYETKAGRLVASDQVKLEAFAAARLTRDAILNVPNKVSHELASESDPAKIHLVLTEALNKALDELAAEGRRRAGIAEDGR